MQFGIGLRLGPPRAAPAASSAPYDPDAQALFARFEVEPEPERKRLISDRFIAGKATSWWPKLDALWVHAAHAAEAGRLNWLSSAFNCLPVNDPAFVVDRGYASDGMTSYLDTQFNPAAGGAKFTRNSASFGLRSNTDAGLDGGIGGFIAGGQGVAIQPRDTANRYFFRINQSANTGPGSIASTTARGLFVVSRASASEAKLYVDGVAVLTSGAASVPPVNGNLRLGGVNDGSLRAAQFSMGFIGAGMTQAEVAGIRDWFEPYRIAVGVA